MAHARKFRFGIQLVTAPDGPSWAETARKVEDLGFSSLFLPDHFGDQLSPVPALMAAADATTTLRVGALVWDNDYKHPVVLAKEAATIDVLSGGRLEFGIGAGWMNTDYEQAGIPKERDGVRIAKLAEAIEIYRGLWGPDEFSFSGEHYQIAGLNGFPKPAQQPHPPLLIGGGGPKMLALAARHADIVGINPAIPKGYIDASASAEVRPDRLDTKVGWLRDAVGDRLDDLELNILVFATSIGPEAAAQRAGMAQMFGVSEDDFAASPYVWFGDAKEVADSLRAARERWGTSYFVVQPGALDQVAPVIAELAGT
ncbi:MAG TPA: TIGR03621 family F420-dependent LLM class oxidoreductase [Acidimicrobiales bacterium]|jgi:probable F420-dependent oxidoreductase|nr:TIGR03621 family F420-dependent LLM class oxidoreductase [Acidimicrobiales bacterium]